MRRTSIALLLAPLLVFTVGLSAQTSSEDDAAPEPNAVQSAAREEVEDTPDPSLSDLPPDDYEASEQISEDLSVSFPVDI